MKLIVAGSREIIDEEFVSGWLDKMNCALNISEVVSGTCRGPDTFGEDWARENWVHIKRFPANWDEFGRAAGPIRNREMAKYADVAIVFISQGSRGAKNMMEEMIKERKPVMVISL